MAKDTFYFTHDFNARQDAKIKRLIMKHGMAGYGMFWSIVEDLYNNANALPTDYESIAFDLRITTEVVTSIIKDFGLFVVDGDTFGSMSVQGRLDARALKSKKARDSAHKRWDNDANALPTDSDSNAIKERKEKERIEKERTLDGEPYFIEPDLFEVFWNAYGKKLDKVKCQREWFKIDHPEYHKIIEHAPKFVKASGDFICNPLNYLEGRKWQDEQLPDYNRKPNGKQPIDKNAPIVWDDQAIKDYIENPFISQDTKEAFLIERRQERKQESNTLKLNA